MDKRVHEYLAKKHQANNKYGNLDDPKYKSLYDKYRADVLIDAGLYDIKYIEKSEENEYMNHDYFGVVYDKETETNRCCIKIPIEVTDEEFEQIAEFSSITPPKGENTDSSFLYRNIDEKIKLLALIMCLIGIIASIIVGITYGSLIVAIIGAFLSWAGSLCTYGFGELISIVKQISQNNRK